MEIRCVNLSKSFNGNQVIKHITLTIQTGLFTTILGPSGCGKTTLLRMISGLETPDEGEIWFDGLCVYSSSQSINLPAEKRNLGFVFQDFALWPHMSLYENVAFGLRCRKETENLEEKVMDALKAVHLEGFEKRYPHQCSGGQQQRVALARAIAVAPNCILFDEPLSALDALLREAMRNEIHSLTRERNLTSIFVTHDQMEAMTLSDQVIVMNVGKIEMIGTPEEVYSFPTTPFVAEFIGKSNWMNDTQMIRPEKICVTPIDHSINLHLHVKTCQFIGRDYQLLCEYKGKEWILHSPQKVNGNTPLSVYIKEEDIFEFKGEKENEKVFESLTR